MNMNIISKYLQFLRKSNNYKQDDLAKELGISRQAVSKWETGTTIPDLEVLLKISKLYDITINDILEPKIQPQRITDFEQISTISEKELKEVQTSHIIGISHINAKTPSPTLCNIILDVRLSFIFLVFIIDMSPPYHH